MTQKSRQEIMDEKLELQKQYNTLMGKLGGLTKELNYQKELVKKLQNKKQQSASEVLAISLKKDLDNLINSMMDICNIAVIGKNNDHSKDELRSLFKSIMAICILTLDALESEDNDE